MRYERIARLQSQGKTLLYAGAMFIDNAYKRAVDEMERAYPQPRWQLLINGDEVSAGVANRLMSLTLTDNRGLEADVLEVTLSDHDGALAIPPKGAVLELRLGWHTTGLVYKGAFIANEITHQGTPDTLTIRAMSADLKDTLKQKKERSFDNTTLGKIVEQIAHEHNIVAEIEPTLAAKEIYHVDQNESDISLLTRLAEEFDAAACIKDDVLLFLPIGTHKTIGGADLPWYLIDRSLGDSHNYSETSDNITGVRTYFYDVAKKDKVAVLAGNEDETVKEIRYVHRDQASATDTAVAFYRKAQRATAHLSYDLAHGDPVLIPEMPVIVFNLKDTIDAMDWTLTNITHSLGDDGYTCSLELERALGEISEIMPPIRIGEPEDKKKDETKADTKKDANADGKVADDKGKQTKSQGGKKRRAAKKKQAQNRKDARQSKK